MDVHSSPSSTLYFNTIRVSDLQKTSFLTYNFKTSIPLTEDRTIKDMYSANGIIRRSVIQGDNEQFMREFISAPKESYEACIDMNWGDVPSQTFLNVMKEIDFKDITNPSLLAYYRKATSVCKTPTSVVRTDIEVKQLALAINFCNSINYPVDKYRINVTEDLSERVLGMAYEGEIYISRRTFMQGTKQVAATVLEEFLHLEHKYQDETYEFQTYLFDVIVSLGERLNGEPV
jgi:hypothetical protein